MGIGHVQVFNWSLRVGGETIDLSSAPVVTDVTFTNRRIVDEGRDQMVNEGDTVMLEAMVNDPDLINGSTLTYTWRIAADNGLVVAPGNSRNFSFQAENNGVYIKSSR